MRAFGAALVGAILACGSAMAQTQAPSSGQPVHLDHPDWISKPTIQNLVDNYPYEALQKNASGRAVIKCTVDRDGGLRDCVVLGETPKGLGFGRAALTMRKYFRLSKSAAGAEVTIPLSFFVSNDPPPRTVPSQSMVTIDAAPWSVTPTKDDVLAAFPASTTGKSTRAFVDLKCHIELDGSLHPCEVAKAEPAGMGFEAAALSLSSKFKVDADWIINIVPKVSVDIPIQFAAADDDIWKDTSLGKIAWTRTPSPEDVRTLFPTAALKAGVNAGSATVDCVVAHDGALSQCRAESENPQGLGMGQTAVQIAQQFAMSPWTSMGRRAEGAQLKMPIQMVYDEKAPTPATKP